MTGVNAQAEPAIYRTTRMYGTVLENVVTRPDHTPDPNDRSLTENARSAPPTSFIGNIVPGGLGALPPLSRLPEDQMMYPFISGFTARIPGTEQGVALPGPIFSTCSGAAFMPRRPGEYVRPLAAKVRASGAKVWLINAGRTGGRYGEGQRMSIRHTRRLIGAALNGELAGTRNRLRARTRSSGWRFSPISRACVESVPTEMLNPRAAWADPAAYDRAARPLAGMFRQNFGRFAEGGCPPVTGCMPEHA